MVADTFVLLVARENVGKLEDNPDFLILIVTVDRGFELQGKGRAAVPLLR